MPLVIGHGGSLSVKLMQLQTHDPANTKPPESDLSYFVTTYTYITARTIYLDAHQDLITFWFLTSENIYNLSRCPLGLDKILITNKLWQKNSLFLKGGLQPQILKGIIKLQGIHQTKIISIQIRFKSARRHTRVRVNIQNITNPPTGYRRKAMFFIILPNYKRRITLQQMESGPLVLC